MASASSNYPQIGYAISQIAQTFNMRRRVQGGKRLGELVVQEIAAEILKRSLNEQVGPSGQDWADLDPKYVRWKVQHGYSPKKNVMTGEMLSLEEIQGEVTITSDQVIMTYGKSERTKQLAEWAQEDSKSRHRPKREFMDLDPQIEDHVDQLLDSAADDHLRNFE